MRRAQGLRGGGRGSSSRFAACRHDALSLLAGCDVEVVVAYLDCCADRVPADACAQCLQLDFRPLLACSVTGVVAVENRGRGPRGTIQCCGSVARHVQKIVSARSRSRIGSFHHRLRWRRPPHPRRLLPRLRRAFPTVRLRGRLDGGFAAPDLLGDLESAVASSASAPTSSCAGAPAERLNPHSSRHAHPNQSTPQRRKQRPAYRPGLMNRVGQRHPVGDRLAQSGVAMEQHQPERRHRSDRAAYGSLRRHHHLAGCERGYPERHPFHRGEGGRLARLCRCASPRFGGGVLRRGGGRC
jgi:hypothetical protein